MYRMNMKKAISITLSEDNLLWLRGQAERTSRGSVSEVVNRLVGETRKAGGTDPDAIRSVAGTIDLPDDDPDLAAADAHLRSLFTASARQPTLVRKRQPRPRNRKTRGG